MERCPCHTSIVLAWCVLTLVVMGSPSAQAQHTLRYQETGPLDLVMTGNTLGLSKQLDLNGPGTDDSIGTFIAADPTATDDTPLNISNPWFVGTTNSWTQNGSSAELILPANASVVYAELLWGGSYDYVENVSANLNDPITLSSPGGSQLVTPDPTAAATLQLMASTGFMVNYYTRSAVVTSFVSTHHAATYSVAGVPATQAAQINNLNAAGWTLVVVYETADGPIRDVSVFSGAAWIEDGSPTDVVTTNLCAPETGPVSGKLAVSAIDGDCDRVGDQFQIAPDSSPFVALSGPNNPVDNFFASQINGGDGLMDTLGTFGSLNHDAAGGNNVIGARQGWDLTTVALSSANGHLINSQNTATLRGSTLSGGEIGRASCRERV